MNIPPTAQKLMRKIRRRGFNVMALYFTKRHSAERSYEFTADNDMDPARWDYMDGSGKTALAAIRDATTRWEKQNPEKKRIR